MTRPTKEDCKNILARWSCARDSCQANWTSNTWILNEKCGIPAQDLTKDDYIGQKCKVCRNNDNALINYPIVIERLRWNKWYRVFGTWGCSCGQTWYSSYTWIRLQKYKDVTPASDLNSNSRDYYGQTCKMCGNDHNYLVDYHHLGGNYGKKKKRPHRSDLCEKCLNDEKCQLQMN